MLTGDTVGTPRRLPHKWGLAAANWDMEDALANPLDFDGFANVYPEDKI
jgi:H+-transporting ATPase